MYVSVPDDLLNGGLIAKVGPEPAVVTKFQQPDGTIIWVVREISGAILSRSDWEEIRRGTDRFYEIHDDEDILTINQEVYYGHFPDERPARPARLPVSTRKSIPKSGHIYLIRGVGTRYCKIGLAANLGRRLDQLDVLMPFKIEVLHTFPSEDLHRDERVLHARFSNKRVEGEWFVLDDDDVAWISSIECGDMQP